MVGVVGAPIFLNNEIIDQAETNVIISMFGEKVQNFERFDKLQVPLTEGNEATDEIFRKQATLCV